MNGRVNGESLTSFLPQALRVRVPADRGRTDRELMVFLKDAYGEACLVDLLVEHFFALGSSGADHADRSWRKLGLDPKRRTRIGLALQAVLTQVDRTVEAAGIEALGGHVDVGNDECALRLGGDALAGHEYRATVAADVGAGH
ncbi:MAG: hypothetical protein PVJ83_01100 [Gammaproteobacteria bacterium]|jgi:hypothetical protein